VPLRAFTWSDGISSSGGVLQLRRVGTTPEVLDAVAWGSATLTAGGEGLPVLVSLTGSPYKRARSSSGALIDSNMNREELCRASPSDYLTNRLSTSHAVADAHVEPYADTIKYSASSGARGG